MTAEAGAEAPVDVVTEDPRWEALGFATLAARAARTALVASGRDPERHEISVLGCDDARIAALNAAFRGKAAPTNVLSWPAFDNAVPAPDADGEPLFLGDLALAYETCAREAAEVERTVEAHVLHLVVHGVLHLLGHDHQNDAEAGEMEALEAKILASMGVSDPYE